MTEQDRPLSELIEAARQRSVALARRSRDFVDAHPVASLAGGIAIGALIAGLLVRRKRNASTEVSDTLDAGSARLIRLAALGAELALAYASRAASAGKDGIETIEDQFVGHLSQIGDSGAQAGRKLGDLSQIVLTTLREAGEAALHKLTGR